MDDDRVFIRTTAIEPFIPERSAAGRPFFKILFHETQGDDSGDRKEVEKERSEPLIRRVPLILHGRKNFSRYFEPRLIAFGPLHHGKPELEWAEELKGRLAAEFIRGGGFSPSSIVQIIIDRTEILKQCYAAEDILRFNHEQLAWIFIIDGCALLQFMHLAVTDKCREFGIRRDIEAFVTQDVFLLENQLPYELFQLLPSRDIHRPLSVIAEFIEMNKMVVSLPDPMYNPYGILNVPSPVHLLHLFRISLLDKYYSFHIDLTKLKRKITPTPTPSVRSFRSIKDLKAIGVDFKPSPGGCLADVNFESRFLGGTLSLPAVSVDDSTASKFLNMVAYEMCPDFPNEFEVITYLCFLDSLINQAEDVKELKRAKVVINALGSDDRVANLFNEIASDLVSNHDIYGSVKTKIAKHCSKKSSVVATWISQAIEIYFSSPWALIAFLAAALGLVLTSIQTWYAMHP